MKVQVMAFVTVIITFAFVEQARCKEPVRIHTPYLQESTDKLADEKFADKPARGYGSIAGLMEKLVSHLIDDLFGQTLRVSSLHRSDFINTTLVKPGQITIPRRPRLPLLIDRFSSFFPFPGPYLRDSSGSHRAGYKPQVRIKSMPHHQVRAISVDEIEAKAVAAAEAWDFYGTPFLDADEAANVFATLRDRGDVSCTKLPYDSSSRAKFIFTNPDLPVERTEYYVLLLVENVDLESADPWANVMASIGVSLDQIGDVVVLPSTGAVYVVVEPNVEKKVIRLLPKELPGAGVTVSKLESGVSIPEGGEVQQLIMQRLDKRQKK